MLAKIKKLKGRGVAEIYDRGRQGAKMFAERFGLSLQAKLLSEAKLLAMFDLYNISNEDLFIYFRERTTPKFYPSFDNIEETLKVLREKFPEEESAIIEKADRIGEGFFDLLGYENLNFDGKIPDWHFDPISGKTSPKIHWSNIEEVNAAQTGDKKIIWELNRHQYFAALGRAYLLTKNEKYAEVFIAHLESWFAENPPKIGVNWLSSLELAFRSISWIWAFYFFKDSPAFTAASFAQMLKYLYLHGLHIENYLSVYFSPNTHLTGEALGLYFLGLFFSETTNGKRWREKGYKILLDTLDFQVCDDGVYVEQASHYQRYTTDFYLNLWILRELSGEKIEVKHRGKLEKLLDFLLHISQPNGETALFGDDDGGRFYFLDERPINDFRPTLALGATLLEHGDLKFAANGASAELLWLLGVEGLEKFEKLEAIEQSETSKAFKIGGFFTIRDSWQRDANFLLIDCGRHGFLNCGHAHSDALSFTFSANGVPVFIDSGTYNYTSDLAAREYFRSSRAHNCLTVNGESSSIPAGAFSWKTTANLQLLEWKETADEIIFRGTHDGFVRFGVNYEREVLWRKNDSVILTDKIRSNESNSYELIFIISPYVEIHIDEKNICINDEKNSDKTLLNIYTEMVAEKNGNNNGGVWCIENCEISPRYGAKITSKKLIFSAPAQGNIEFVTTLKINN